MHGRDKAKAIAHLMELTVRTAFASDALRERHLTDWPALRYLSQVGDKGRTRDGLANYLGTSVEVADVIASRLLDDDVLSEALPENRLDITPIGQAILSVDPLNFLSAAVAMLSETDLDKLARSLEAIHEKLSSPSKPGQRLS